MDSEQKQRAARTFLSVLGKPDAAVLESVVAPDVIWTFPGSSPISGEAHGIDGILKRAGVIAAYGVKVEILHATFSYTGGVSMILHNTAIKNGRTLDEHLCAVFAFKDGRISRLDTYLSDVAMAEAFFG